jgi:hypothetical protein
MGVYTDILANAKTIDTGGAAVAIDRVIVSELEYLSALQKDPAYTSDYAAKDEVQSLAAYNCTVTSGNFTLAFTLWDGTTFTTNNIAYDANAATVESAIDAAATAANVTDWVNGHISVSLTTDLNAGAATITFNGSSVNIAKHGTIVIADVDLSGGSVGAVSTPNDGVAAVDEVQSIGIYKGTVNGGNFTLTINVDGEDAFNTANIAYNSNAAAIETIIDTAASGNITGWAPGDISVSGTDLTSTPIVLTYNGSSVSAADHTQVVLNDIDLTGVGTPGAVSTTNDGVAGTDEVQSIAVYDGTVSGGNFTLTINVNGESPVTTGNIIYNATAATIEGIIDTALTGNITGWANGDISVSGGDLTTSPVVLTYDGNSVHMTDQGEVTTANVDLSGGGSLGAVSTTTPGVDAVDEVQSIATFNGTVNGGNYKLTINVSTDPAFDTGNIAYNSNAAAIEGIIDTAATGNITGWTNGDISVSGGDLTTNPVVLTFDGFSVDGANQVTTIIADVDLTGPGTPGDISTTNEGATPVNEVQSIAIYPVAVSSGNYTLTINVSTDPAFTTGNITYGANAATIEGIIDTAASGNVTSWSNGDISVSGGPLTTNAVILTFDGTSVAGANQVTTVINDVDLKGGTPGTVSVTTNGQTNRMGWAVLYAVGVIDGTPPVQGVTPGTITIVGTRLSNIRMPKEVTLRALAKEAAYWDENAEVETKLLEAMGLR